MTFKVGDTVVYPHHGAALIEAIETRQIKGVDKTYLVLKVAQGDLTVRVPADNAEFVGVRDVVGQDGLDRREVVVHDARTDPGAVGQDPGAHRGPSALRDQFRCRGEQAPPRFFTAHCRRRGHRSS